MGIDEFIEMVKGKVKGMPYRPLPLPKMMSQRPLFYG